MSGLYIKLFTEFYSHRKTARLRARIGEDAFWIPPRLWAYAAEHQNDGDFSEYSSQELAMLIGCDKHASSILQALKECGFIDHDGKIHDWEEHNGFHSTFSRRAKAAADARWAKKEKKQKKEKYIHKDTEIETETETSIATSMLEASAEASLFKIPKDNEKSPSATETSTDDGKSQEDGKAIEIEAFRIRVGSMLRRRPTTAWSQKEMKALKAVMALKTPEEDICDLEKRYSSGDRFLRRDIITLLNNWNGEIDKAKNPNGYSDQQTTGKLWGTSTPADANF